MDTTFATDLPAAGSDLEARLVELNNVNAVMLAWIEPERFRELAAASFALLRTGDADAFLLAFDETAAYDGFNFRWFAVRYPRFVYIDRVVVAEAARGRGIGGALYAELFRRVRASGRSIVTLEINDDPPNPGSERFHARLGFAAVGSARTPSGKAVTYHVRDLERA